MLLPESDPASNIPSRHTALLGFGVCFSFLWDFSLHRVILNDLCRYPYSLVLLQTITVIVCVEIRRRQLNLPLISLRMLGNFFLPSTFFCVFIIFGVSPYFHIYSNTFLLLRSFLPVCVYGYGVIFCKWPRSSLLLLSTVVACVAGVISARLPVGLTPISLIQAALSLASFVVFLFQLVHRRQEISVPDTLCLQAVAINIALMLAFHTIFINGEAIAGITRHPRELLTWTFFGDLVLCMASGCAWLVTAIRSCIHSSPTATILAYFCGSQLLTGCVWPFSTSLVKSSCSFAILLLASSVVFHFKALQRLGQRTKPVLSS